MTIYTARVEERPMMTDPKMLVLSPDVAGVACKATDFIFDFSQAACYRTGVLPATNAEIETGGETIGVSIKSQGTTAAADGSYTIVWFPSTPGDGSLSAKAVVQGGKLVGIDIVNPGAGLVSSNRAIDWGATAGFSSNPSVDFHHTQFRNLARNQQSTIKLPVEPAGRLGARGLFSNKYTGSGGGSGSLPVFDGKGIKFTKDMTQGLFLTGSFGPRTIGTIAQARPGEPQAEGFIDYLETVWCRNTAFNGNTSPWCANDGRGGFQMFASGEIYERGAGVSIIPAPPLNTLVMVALLRRFDVGANTQTLYPFYGVGSGVTALASKTGKVPTAYNSNGLGEYVGSMDGSAAAAMTGTIYRMTREYSGIAGFTNGEVLARLNAEWAALSGRYS